MVSQVVEILWRISIW